MCMNRGERIVQVNRFHHMLVGCMHSKLLKCCKREYIINKKSHGDVEVINYCLEYKILLIL